jgi:hypothetical protein
MKVIALIMGLALIGLAAPASAALAPYPPVITSIHPGNGQATINFTPGFDGGSPITDYLIQWAEGDPPVSTGVTSSPILVTGLNNGDSYRIRLLAVNAEGGSEPTDWVGFALPAHVPGTVPVPIIVPPPAIVIKPPPPTIVPLVVKARPQAKKLPPLKKVTVVKKVTPAPTQTTPAPTTPTKVKTKCFLYGEKLTGKNKRINCKTAIKPSGKVRVTAHCSDGLKIRVIVKTTDTKWKRTWKVKNQRKLQCSVIGNG